MDITKRRPQNHMIYIKLKKQAFFVDLYNGTVVNTFIISCQVYNVLQIQKRKKITNKVDHFILKAYHSYIINCIWVGNT